MSAMGIGLIAFSLSNRKDETTTKVESSVEASVTPTPEIIPTPTQEEELGTLDTIKPKVESSEKEKGNPLKRDEYPEINAVVKKFLNAKLKCDEEKLASCVTDTNYIDLERLQKKTEFVEDYKNIEVYTKKGQGEIDFIVYVYEELKIASIDTYAPAMDEMYVKKVDGEYKLVFGDIKDKTAEYIVNTRNEEDVIELIDEVQKKLNIAMNKDEQLREFCEKLKATSQQKTKKSSKK